MIAARLLGSAILAIVIVSAGVLGYDTFRRLEAEGKAKDAAFRIEQAARAAIASRVEQVIEIELTTHTVILVDNRILLDDLPIGEIEAPFHSRFELDPGRHIIHIAFENGAVVVQSTTSTNTTPLAVEG